jgi:hypothetical protein
LVSGCGFANHAVGEGCKLARLQQNAPLKLFCSGMVFLLLFVV